MEQHRIALKERNGIEPMEVSDEKDSTVNGREEVGGFTPLKTAPSLLPEIWEGILLDLPLKDFLSAINSSVEWNELVHTKKTVKLMPLIIPLVMEYLPLNIILGLRLVDKLLFKGTIDSILQTLSTNLEEVFEHKSKFVEHHRKFLQGKLSLPSKQWLVRRKYNFGFTEVNTRFLTKMSPPPHSCPPGWSPILSNYVSINHPVTTLVNNDGESLEGEEALSTLLTHFGRHVLSLNLNFVQYDIQVPLSLRKLSPILTSVPNLKILKLDAQVGIPNTEFHYLSQERLPVLPKLEYLSLKRFHREGRFFHQNGDSTRDSDVPTVLPLLQKYGTQLKVLKCGGSFLAGREMTVQLLNELLPCLIFMEVDEVNPQTMIKLGMVSWKLQKLKVSGYMLDGHRCCRLAHLVTVLNNFKESLNSLEVVMTFSDGKTRREPKDQVEKGVMKPLQKLKTLTTAIRNFGTDWFWETFTNDTCPVLEQLDLLEVELMEDAGNYLPRNDGGVAYSLAEYKRAFGRIPTLKKVVVWYERKPRLVIRCRIPSCLEETCVGNCSASYE